MFQFQFLFALKVVINLTLLGHLTVSHDPGYVIKSYGVTTDTLEMVRQIQKHLYLDGRSVLHLHSAMCLDSDWITGLFSNGIYASTCKANKASQAWRFNGGRLRVSVASEDNPPPSGTVEEGCLTCWSGLEDCILYVMQCRARNGAASQRFHIRIHPSQLDLPNGKVYFSIHSTMHPGRCVAPYKTNQQNTGAGQNGTPKHLFLDECVGSPEQSFYMEHLDFSEEVNKIRIQTVRTLGGITVEFIESMNKTIN